MSQSISRRKFLGALSMAGMTLPFIPISTLSRKSFVRKPESRKVHIFSKHLQWLDYDAMADFVAACGFDGADITVRPGGHVEPNRVEEDLPRVVTALKKAGREVTMITTSILSADDPNAESIIRTAGRLDIQLYRLGWYPYDPKHSVSENIRLIEQKLRGLAELGKAHNVKAAYQNHSGRSFGSAVWDLAHSLQAINSPWLGCQYDVRHAVVEGANSWTLGFDYVRHHINSLDVKDFQWTKENGRWTAENVPLGQGLVDFDEYFQKIRSIPAEVPICLHMEYPLGSAENGSRVVTMPRDDIKKAMTRDLKFIRDRV